MTARTTPRTRTTARTAVAAAVAAALVALGGCASIPTSGPVTEGRAVVSGPGDLYLRAPSPGRDASPQQIVQGFLAAQAAGPTGSFDVATEFLTADTAGSWVPLEQVAILASEPELEVDEAAADAEAATVRATATVVGVVDARGVYTEQPPGTTTELVYGLRRDGEGQWRIGTTDDGLAMTATNFAFVFRATTLYFPTPDREYLVPDARWFPSRNWQTYAVRETLEGPAPWLSSAVTTVAPEGTALSIDAVTVEGSGPIAVHLTDVAADAPPADRAVLAAQLEASLGDPVPRPVELYVNSSPLVEGTTPALRPAVTAQDPVVLADGRVMALQGRAVEPVEHVAPLAGLQPTAIAFRGPVDESTFVVRDGSSRLVTAPTADEGPTALLTGENLLAPSVDRLGFVWSGPQVQDGSLQVVDLDGAASAVAAPWLEGRTIMSVRVAPDGSRVAVVSASGAGLQVHVAGVVREQGGRPTQLSEPLRVGQPLVEATQVVWVDRALLGVLGRSGGDAEPLVHLVPVGGPTRKTSPVEGAVSVAAGTGTDAMLLGTDDGTLYTSSASSLWTQVTTEVRLPTFPG